MKRLILFLFFFGSTLSFTNILAQADVNQMDAQGKRHGVWKKYFPNTKQLRYEGQFDHGKETGTFKFYCEECRTQPMAVKEFDATTGIAHVKYFTKKGKLVSEGKMTGKKHMGEWVYYFEKSKEVMTRELYQDGKLNGKKVTYYPNGKIAEEANYSQGFAEGEAMYYAPTGVLLKKLNFRENKLVGPAAYYDSKGDPKMIGQYKNDKKDGIWKYYKNGKFEKEETFPKPLKRIKQ